MDWLCVVPFIGPDWNMREFLSRVEVDLLDRFLFIDNSRDRLLEPLKLTTYGARVEYHSENLGVPRSWNIGLREGHEQTILCSASVRFTAGMRQWLKEAEAVASQWGLVTLLHWHLILLGRPLVEELGLFDENFYPGDWSDNDYIKRIMIAKRRAADGEECLAAARPMSCTRAGYNIAQTATKFRDNPKPLLEYYARKWGGEPPNETYTHPFNDPANGLGYWEEVSVAELKKRYGV